MTQTGGQADGRASGQPGHAGDMDGIDVASRPNIAFDAMSSHA